MFIYKELKKVFNNYVTRVNEIIEDFNVLGGTNKSEYAVGKNTNSLFIVDKNNCSIKRISGKKVGTHYVYEYNAGNKNIHLEYVPGLLTAPKNAKAVKLN